MSLYYLGLGSNVGDRAGHLRAALRLLANEREVILRRGSAVYQTKPVGRLEQPDFLNLVVEVESALTPPDLLAVCLLIELRLGRVRSERWGPRTIDLDLLASPGLVWSDEQLQLPHPRLAERAFVLTPLAELAPELRLGDATVGALATARGRSGLEPFATWAEFTADPPAPPPEPG